MDRIKIIEHDLSEVIEPSPPTSPGIAVHTASRLAWWRDHPYASALSAAGALLVVGVLIVSARSATAPSRAGSAWGGANINLLNPTGGSGAPLDTRSTPISSTQSGSYGYIPIPSSGADEYTPSSGSFDFNAFITELARGGSSDTSSGADANTSILDAYSFIPTGFVSTTTPTKKRDRDQQVLFDYGNEAGAYIQTLEEAHRDQSQVLKNWLEDRTDPAKSAAVVQLGKALWETGRFLLTMEQVPGTATALNTALAESYIEIGSNLALIPKTQSNADFLKAINTYNASADTFAKNYIAVVNLFGSYGVTFSPDDPGSVFTFKPVSL